MNSVFNKALVPTRINAGLILATEGGRAAQFRRWVSNMMIIYRLLLIILLVGICACRKDTPMKQVSFDLTSKPSVTLTIDVDYGQFYLIVKEDIFDSGTNNFWSKEALRRGLAVSPGGFGISTFRKAGPVPVELNVFSSEPTIDLDRFDHIVEGGLTIEGSSLGLGMWHEQWQWGKIAPGKYRLRVYYGGLDSVKDELTGKDYYLIYLWPGEQSEVRVLKQAEFFSRMASGHP